MASRGFSFFSPDFMDMAPNAIFIDFQNSVSAWRTMMAGRHEAARVDKQYRSNPVAYWYVGVAVDNTINSVKLIDQEVFEIV